MIEIKNVVFEQQIKAGFNPMQPRVPAGNSDGGQWTESGGGLGGSRNPPLRRVSDVPQRRKPHSHVDSPYYDPVYDIYDPPIEPVYPIENIIATIYGGVVLKPLRGVARGAINEAMDLRNAMRLRAYLRTARNLPDDVVEIGKGVEKLTQEQMKSLKNFIKTHSRFKKNIEIRLYSDGRAIFSVKQPENNIPNSYTVWEKHVDVLGRSMRLNKTTVGAKGELIHIKPY